MKTPTVTIYVVAEADGKQTPVAVTLEGVSLPILHAEVIADPNGTLVGSRAVAVRLTIQARPEFVEIGTSAEIRSDADLRAALSAYPAVTVEALREAVYHAHAAAVAAAASVG